MGPNYANLIVGYVEAQIFSRFTSLTFEIYSHYIGDCTDATSPNLEQLDNLLFFVQYFYPVLESSCTISNTSFAFLVVSVNINNTALTTNTPIHTHTSTSSPTLTTRSSSSPPPSSPAYDGSALTIMTL